MVTLPVVIDAEACAQWAAKIREEMSEAYVSFARQGECCAASVVETIAAEHGVDFGVDELGEIARRLVVLCG